MRKKVAITLSVGLTFLGAASNVAAADPETSATTTVIVAQAVQAPAAPAADPQEPVVREEISSKDGLVTLDFQEADIKNVLKVLAYNSDVNIVAGPEVAGLVTIQLNDVPWQRALEVILATYGFGYERKGNIITVTTIENLKKRREDAQALADQEPLVTRTFVLNFGRASEIIASVEKMRTPRGTINFDQRTNALIVRDIESNMELMADVIDKLDAVTPQVLIEAKVVETTLSNTDNLGIDWTVVGTASGAARPHTFPFEVDSDNVYTPTNFPAAGEDLFSYGTLDASQLQAVFEILKTRSDTNILSNPKIVTLDNQPARIVVGSQYPIPSYTYNEEQARLQVSGWEYKDIGIIFEVTPHVNNANFVTLDLEPRITAILDFVTVENTQLPRLSTEEAETKVMIKDGQTLVIAGLIKDQTTETKRKVPILGDIPLIGFFFQKTEMTKTKTDLMIFLTPHIITPEVEKKDASLPPSG